MKSFVTRSWVWHRGKHSQLLEAKVIVRDFFCKATIGEIHTIFNNELEPYLCGLTDLSQGIVWRWPFIDGSDIMLRSRFGCCL